MVITASGIACGHVRKTTTTELPNMAAILQRDKQPWFTMYFFDIGHPDYNQLTTFKTRYPLTSITWPHRRLKFTTHRGHKFLWRKKKRKRSSYNTGYFHLVTHSSTKPAQQGLMDETWYTPCSLRAGSHLGAYARAAKSKYQIAKRFGGAESGEEARIKWARPDLCNFFISASPERSEIPLVEKRQGRENCQSKLFDNLLRVQQSTRSKKISWIRVFLTFYPSSNLFLVWTSKEEAGNRS